MIEPWQQQILDHLCSLRDEELKHIDGLSDPSMTLYTRHNGEFVDVTDAHIKLAQSVVDRLNEAIANAERTLGIA